MAAPIAVRSLQIMQVDPGMLAIITTKACSCYLAIQDENKSEKK
jgi:hypothetical protein